MATNSPTLGSRLRQAIEAETPLQIVGVINAYCGLLAEQAGFRAIYLSGAGVSNATLGVPDLGIIGINDVVIEANRITSATSLPLIVDCDTGWGSSLTIRRGVRELIGAGVAGIHIEDQIDTKRCGHRDGKKLVSAIDMQGRISAAVDARTDADFMVMARTDAYGVNGLGDAIDRAQKYVDAGADAIFAEAMTDISEYTEFTQAVKAPVLANMTEFGKTPLMSREQLESAGVAMILYPLSAFRAMSFAALNVFRAIREDGTQANVTDTMQTRDELYEVLKYFEQEQDLDAELGKKNGS